VKAKKILYRYGMAILKILEKELLLTENKQAFLKTLILTHYVRSDCDKLMKMAFSFRNFSKKWVVKLNEKKTN